MMILQRGLRGLMGIFELLSDFVSIALAFLLTKLIFDTGHLLQSELRPLALITGIILITFFFNDLYQKHKAILNIEETRLILKSLIISALVTFALLFFMEESRNPDVTVVQHWTHHIQDQLQKLGLSKNLSRLELSTAFVFMFPIASFLRYFLFKFEQGLHRKGIGNERVLIYGRGDLARRLRDKIRQSPKSGYYLVGLINDTQEKLTPAEDFASHLPLLGTFNDLEKLCQQYKVDRILVADNTIDPERLVEVLRKAQTLGVELEFVPALHSLFAHRIHLSDVDGLPLIAVSSKVDSPIHRFGKRLFDLVLGFTILLVSLIPMILVALIIKLKDPGPILFNQNRVGLGGRTFVMHKFRTMKTDTDAYADTPNSNKDNRITPVGRFLRRTSLDELPQIFNVLKGDMALVGPRPEMPYITERYTAQEKERLRVKPGITGLWQISADRKQQIHDNIDYDLYYIEHQSLLLDVVILMRTFFSVIRGIGAY